MDDAEAGYELRHFGSDPAHDHVGDTERLVLPSSQTRSTSRESYQSSLKKSINAKYHQLSDHKGEQKKTILRDGIIPVLAKIWIHAIPLAAIIPIATLNIIEYYVGPQYQGSLSSASQNLSNLGLQVAAKLFELVVAASLGLTVMDILRYILLFDTEGLPLGILGAQKGFSSLEYIWSAEFRRGRKGLSTPWQKWLLPLYVIILATIMVLIGPAAAVLIIPARVDDYKAGGTQFWMVGGDSFLRPDNIDASVLLPGCLSPTPDNVTLPALNTSSCPWNGYPGISAVYEQWRTFQGPFNNAPVVLVDNMFTRHILQHRGIGGIGLETWSVGTDVSIDTWSAMIAGSWNSALGKAPIATNRLSRFHTYGFMDRRGTAAAVESENATLPTVRTVCITDTQADFGRTQFKYPILAPFQVWSDIIDSFFLTSDSTSKENDTSITGQWLPIPTEPSQTNDDARTLTDQYPSALLQIRVPRPLDDTGLQTVLSCSIDARWAPGVNRLGLFLTGEDYHYPEITNTRDPTEGLTKDQLAGSNQAAFGFLPVDDGSWRRVNLSMDWLTTLTPQMDPQNPSRNSATFILESMGLLNETGEVESYDDIHRFVESVVSTMIVDGMSRIGLRYNAAPSPDIPTTASNPAFDVTDISKDTNALNSLIRGSGDALLPPANTAPDNRTELSWSITITGLAYRADNTASRLALSLLFIYAIIALVHIFWSLARCQTSKSWSSLLELLLLSQNSPPAPHALKNTSGGIKDSATYSKRARIRVIQDHIDRPGQEEVQLLWEKGDPIEEARYRKIQVGRAYGAIGQTTINPSDNFGSYGGISSGNYSGA